MAKKKKPNIASIMADHEKMFRSLAPGVFGKVPPVFKGNSKRRKRRDQKRAASQPETSIIDVLSTGVMDAVSGAALAVGGAFGITGHQGSAELASGTTYQSSEKARAQAQSDASSDSASGGAAQADGAGDQSQVSSESASGAHNNLEDYDISQPVKADIDTTDLNAEVEVTEFSASGKRRARAKREKEAAARNFRRQRGENVPPPIMGIPDPAPMNGAGGGGTIGGDQSAEGVTQEESAMATNAAVSAATEYAKQVADLLDKVTTELAALTVRVRNMELLIDRL